MAEQKATFDDWLEYGISQKWITEPFCDTHDGDPHITLEEQKQWDSGELPCLIIVKLINGN